jgi:cob(I)alamin adenosyltransferase
MSIYTKKGDDGSTSLVNGTRVAKNHIRVEAYGTIDELNAHIALLETIVEDKNVQEYVLDIENKLFIIQTYLAIDPNQPCYFSLPDLQKINTNTLEQQIDAMTEQLQTLESFLLLGGHPSIAQCHIARCVCRRAERVIYSLSQQSFVPSEIGCYINRLSDYLFVLSRFVGKLLHIEERTVCF